MSCSHAAEHFCKYEFAGSQAVSHDAYPYTAVLLRCTGSAEAIGMPGCGGVVTNLLEGTWSEDQIRGSTAAPSA